MEHHRRTFSSPDDTSLGSTDSSEKLLLHLIDGGLAGCIFVVPFLLGGRMAVGQFLLVLLAVAVALAWMVRQSMRRHGSWRWSGAELLLVAGAALLVVQIAPLPQPILAWLAPHASSLLPLWSAEQTATFHLDPWPQISLTPAATRAGLVLFLAYGLLFLVTVQRIRTLDDVERLLRWVATAAVLMAVFGLIQFFTNNGKFFWFYEHPFSTTDKVVKGGFTNRNHFAHFLALGVGPLIWWIQHAWCHPHKRSTSQFTFRANDAALVKSAESFRLLALGIVVFAVLLSLSRGGALVAILAAAISVAVCYRAGSLRVRFVVGLVGMALLTIGCLAVYGQEQVTNRLDDFTEGSLTALDRTESRRTIWATTLKAIPDFWLLGSGQGSFQHVYPMYLPWTGSTQYYSHAENGYLQVALETGLLGFVLLLAGVALCGFWCLGSLRASHARRHLVCAGAVAASLAVSVVHSTVDFVWYAPGCMAVVTILAACACRLHHLRGDSPQNNQRRITMPRFAAVAVSASLLVLGGWMLGDRFGSVRAEPDWFRYLLMQRRPLDLVPLDHEEEQPTREEQSETVLAIEQKMIHELELVTQCDPNHAEAHLALAGAYMRLFDRLQAISTVNAMPLSEIGDAAIRSQFSSREALNEWLFRAVGPHAELLDRALWHASKGLTLCPLAGEGYLYLGELCFLNGVPATAKSAYLAQAMKVGPFDGTVLFYAGKEAARRGDLAQTLNFWRQSYNCGRPYQQRLIEFLVGRTHPDHLEAEIQLILQTFQPDIYGLRLLHRAYKSIARPEQMAILQQVYATAAATEAADPEQEDSVFLWLEAMRLYSETGDAARQLECGQNALRVAPNHFGVHQALAYCLADQQNYAEAEDHLRWCLQRKPNHRRLEAKLKEVLQNRIQSEGRTATYPAQEGPRR